MSDCCHGNGTIAVFLRGRAAPVLTGAVAFEQIFRRGPDVLPDVSWEGLKKEVTLAVENEVNVVVVVMETVKRKSFLLASEEERSCRFACPNWHISAPNWQRPSTARKLIPCSVVAPVAAVSRPNVAHVVAHTLKKSQVKAFVSQGTPVSLSCD